MAGMHGHAMGCYVSSHMHAIPSLSLFIFGENRVLKYLPPSASRALFSYISYISKHPYQLKRGCKAPKGLQPLKAKEALVARIWPERVDTKLVCSLSTRK